MARLDHHVYVFYTAHDFLLAFVADEGNPDIAICINADCYILFDMALFAAPGEHANFNGPLIHDEPRISGRV